MARKNVQTMDYCTEEYDALINARINLYNLMKLLST